MSWHFSQALVEEYSAGSSSAGAPYVQSRLIRMQRASSRRGRMTAAFRLSPYGTTLPRSMGGLGEAVLTWFRGAFLARTSLLPAVGLGSEVSVRDCGAKWLGLLARWDPNGCLWKTPQSSLLEGLDVFSETWPRWGMMRGGECWALSTPALPTSENEFGFWQTPVADDSVQRKVGKFNSRGEPRLSAQALMFPTPTAGGALPEQELLSGCSGSAFIGGDGSRQSVADAPCERGACGGLPERPGRQDKTASHPERDGEAISDTECGGSPGGNEQLSIKATDLTSSHGRSSGGGDALGKWRSEPDVGRVAHGVAARVDRLRCIGNGQVPDVVRLAWQILTELSKERIG